MYNHRIGNDARFRVTVRHKSGDKVDISQARDITVEVVSNHNPTVLIPVSELDTSTNPFTFRLRAEDQVKTGPYRAVISYKLPVPDRTPDLAPFVTDCDLITLVQRSSMAGGRCCPDVAVETCEVSAETPLTGERGLKGDTGKTAYECALDGGFAGTEDEFNHQLASIGRIDAVLDSINRVKI